MGKIVFIEITGQLLLNDISLLLSPNVFGLKFIFGPKFVGDQSFLIKICLDLKSFLGSESNSGIFEKIRPPGFLAKSSIFFNYDGFPMLNY